MFKVEVGFAFTVPAKCFTVHLMKRLFFDMLDMLQVANLSSAVHHPEKNGTSHGALFLVQCFPVHCSMSTGPGIVSVVNLQSIDEVASMNLFFGEICLCRVLATLDDV